MVTFRDVKDLFHYIGDAFNSAGLWVQEWPWPLTYLSSPFYLIRDWFYWGDWIWDGLNYWVLIIELEASRAVYKADQAITPASEAATWIDTIGFAIKDTAVRAYSLAMEAVNYSVQNAGAISLINVVEIPNLNNAIADIRATLEALEVPDLAAIIQDISGLKTWRDNFLASLDERITSVISRTIDSVLDRVEW